MNASDQAAEWFIAQRTGELSPEERERFMRWLNDSAANVREYLAIVEVWGSLSGAPAVQSAQHEELIDDLRRQTTVEVLLGAAGRTSIAVSPGARKPARWIPKMAIAGSVLAMIAAAAWISLRTLPLEFSTQRGEQRTVELPDGSILQLNALSRVRVVYGDELRRIEFQEGEALFRVVKDPARPFEVATSDAVVRVLGTVFNVQQRDGGTRVAVVEGKVQVRAVDTSSPPLPLSVNESTRIASGGGKLEAVSVEPRKVTAWTQRRLIFDEEPLRIVVAEFNLYNDVQMTIEGAQLEQQRINGVFDADDPQALIAYLERIRGVKVREQNNGIRLLSADTH